MVQPHQPHMQQQQHQHQGHQPAPMAPSGGAPAAGGGGIGAAVKANPALTAAIVFFSITILFNWIMGAFTPEDKDVRSFLRATSMATSAGGFGALLVQIFAIITNKEKQPTFGQALVCIAIIIALSVLAGAGAIRF